MKTPYQILEISENATDEEIKRAYRKLSKQYHPDITGGDKTKEKQFKEVKTAYDYLSLNGQSGQTQESHRNTSVKLDDWAEAFNNAMEEWNRINSSSNEYRTSGNWTVGELEQKLTEFFNKYGLDATVAIYSRRQTFQIDGIQYWMSKGYMQVAGSWTGEQEGEINYKLTESGREHLKERKELSGQEQLKLKAPKN